MTGKINLVNALLAKDESILKHKETETYEVKSLSKIVGEKFEITLQGLTTKEYMRIKDICIVRPKKEAPYLDETKYNAHLLLSGIVDKELKSTELQKKYGATDPADLMLLLFTVSEIADITSIINKLSGMEDETKAKEVESEIKN